MKDVYKRQLPILSTFHSAYPGIRLHILNHSTPQAIQALKNRLIDFAVVTTPMDIQLPLKETYLKSFPVSYTHLDVYKRQPKYVSQPYKNSNCRLFPLAVLDT